MYAFERAVNDHHTDMLELDVRATSDGHVVVAHDETLERCTNGAGELGAQHWADIRLLDAAFSWPAFRGRGLSIPSFEDVLRAFPGTRLNVEIKSEATIEPFVHLVRRADCLARVCLGSEHDTIADALARLLPQACLFYPRNALAAFVLPIKGGDAPEDDARFTVLDMPLHWEGVTMFDASLASMARAHHKWINVWTVDDPADMSRAIADGVGGIMTDRPDLLRQVLTVESAPRGSAHRRA
jgi:glycerophosphoryl diester phosphodiesterase